MNFSHAQSLSHSQRTAVPGQLRESEPTEATDLLGSQPLSDIKSTFCAPSVRDKRSGIRPMPSGEE